MKLWRFLLGSGSRSGGYNHRIGQRKLVDPGLGGKAGALEVADSRLPQVVGHEAEVAFSVLRILPVTEAGAGPG